MQQALALGAAGPQPGERRQRAAAADEHSLTQEENTEAEKESSRRSIHEVHAHTCVRTYITNIIYIILLAAPLGFYEAVLLPPQTELTERRAHSKNHTTDNHDGRICCRSTRSDGWRATSDADP